MFPGPSCFLRRNHGEPEKCGAYHGNRERNSRQDNTQHRHSKYAERHGAQESADMIGKIQMRRGMRNTWRLRGRLMQCGSPGEKCPAAITRR